MSTSSAAESFSFIQLALALIMIEYKSDWEEKTNSLSPVEGGGRY